MGFHLLIDALRYHGCIGVHIAEGAQGVALVQFPQPVEEFYCPLSNACLAEVLEEQGCGSAVKVEEGFEDLHISKGEFGLLTGLYPENGWPCNASDGQNVSLKGQQFLVNKLMKISNDVPPSQSS